MATKYKGSTKEISCFNAYINLMRAADAVTERVHIHLQNSPITLSQFGVLEALLHLGPLAQNKLAEKLLRSKGNMTLVIDNLEKQNLVKRVRREKDRRHFDIQLTTKGKKIIEDIFPKHVKSLVNEMKVLSPEELETVRDLCRKLGKGQQ